MSRTKVALISLGCPKNLVNSEQMLYLLGEAGLELVSEPAQADAVIVNTCGFIEAAKREAIDTIIEMGELKKAGKIRSLIAAGCLVQRYRDEILKELPEIDAALGTGSYGEVVEAVRASLKGKSVQYYGEIDAALEETGRVVSTGPGWAYLRIAEGCSNRCAFCVIPAVRGRYRSRRMEDIVEEAGALARTGVKELIVIAQDLTRYGTDLYGKRSLAELLKKLCAVRGVAWIRLHYLYPDAFDDALIETVASEKKILKYLDIPIQHINDAILKRMNRRGTGAEIRALLAKLRARIPGVVIRTSLIVGLPGEGEAEFAELCDYLREARIERAGVFEFSPEEGTPAAAMPDRCDADEAARRREIVMDIQAAVMDEWSRGFVGKSVRVLCEGYSEETGLQFGRSFADSPDIDGIVFFSGDCPAGRFAEVKIKKTDGGEWYGEQVQ
ncbi:MAG: 30S ribosomal protein S12 methylthiotransferase RimO [Oscillospiraceae bacterium]|jgi:ribosomal protein S12 methylthiotransferase|nr:30S ribosomal protein S12 methylthiotransferase RimO [Oscillospiraceae bacterium]